MNRNWLFNLGLVFGLALPARAAIVFTNVTPITAQTLTGVAYDGSNTFVVVGLNSTILTASFLSNGAGGLQLTSRSLPISASLYSATHGSGRFVAGGTDARTFYSTNGANWVQSANAFSSPAIVRGLAYNPAGGGRFSAVASIVNASSADSSLAWANSTINDGYALESFRGVAPVGANQFVACGIAGTIRRSGDGGASWTLVKPWNGSEPALLGIASDSGLRSVAVGAAGRIMVSTDGGAAWSNVGSPIGVTNNAVAYTGPNSGNSFVVVGSGGQVFFGTNDNASQWVAANSTTTAHLLGVAFATSGLMQGVGVVVGASGTVLLAGTQPPAPVNLGNQSSCEGSPNPPLCASVTNAVDHPPGTVVIDWYSSATGSSQITNNSSCYLPTDSAAGGPNSGSNYTYFAEARDIRTGFVSTNRTPVVLTINPRPTSVVSGTTAICNGSSTVVQAALTGIGPWTVTWSDGTVSNAVASPATKTVSPANPNPNTPVTNTYTVTALVDLGATTQCPANAGDLTGSAVIRVNPRPTSVVSGTTAICNGSSTVVQAALTGIGPWTVTWSDGTVSNAVASPATKIVSPANPNPNAPVTNTYTVTALIDLGATTQCPANAGDLTGSAVIRVNPRPTSVVSGTTAICNGSSTVVQAALTGIGPWTVTWSDGTVSNAVASPATKTVSPANPNPNTPVTNTYTVTALIDLGATTQCPANAGELTGSAVIRVNPRPTSVVSGTTAICNGSSTVVQAALTGIGPWTVTWSDGTVSNAVASPATKIVSPANPNPNAPVTNTYTVTALIDLGATTQCPANAGDLTGSAVIRVNPRPTSVVSGTTAICNGSSTVVQAALTGIGPWTVTWSDGTVSNAVASPATKIVSPANPNPNAPVTNTYTVTALVDLGATTQCPANAGELTGSAVIRVNPRPTSVVSGTTAICNGSSTVVQAALTGIGPWTVTWSDGTVSNAVASPATKIVSPANPNPNTPVTNTYTVTALIDLGATTQCPANAGDLTGSAVIRVNPRPTSTMLGANTLVCNGDPFTLTNLLTGLGPWLVSWSDGTMQTNSSAPFGPVTNTYTLVQTNSLYPSNTNAATNILVSYAVTNLVTTNTCAGDVVGTNLVSVNPRAVATVSGDTNLCTSGSATIQVALTGIGPWTFDWHSNGVFVTTANVPLPANLPAITNLVASFTNTSPTSPLTSIYTVTNLMDVGLSNAGWNCDPLYISNAVVTVYPALSVSVANANVAIHTNESYPLIAALTGTQPWTVTWSDGVVTTTNASPARRIVSGATVAALGSAFDFYVTNLVDASSGGCLAALGTNVTTITLLPDGAVFFVSGDATNCLGSASPIQVLLPWRTNTSPNRIYGSPWQVTWSDGVVVNYTNLSGTTMVGTRLVSPGATTNYTVTKIIASGYDYDLDLRPPLTYSGDFISGSALIVVKPLPTATVTTTDQIICISNSISIGVLLTGQSPWTVTWSDGVTTTNATANAVYVATPASNFTYTVTSVTDGAGCSGTNLTGSAAITVTNCAPLEIWLGTNAPPTNAVLSWGGNSWLQSAGVLGAPWTNVIKGTLWTTNYWTNPISASQEFFRLAVTNGP